MNTELCDLSCSACRVGAPQVGEQEKQQLLATLPEWTIESQNNIERLNRHFKFKNFMTAMNFANQIAEIAEQQGHHPLITVEWGKVNVQWWTHKIGGLHQNDFICAAKTEQCFKQVASTI